MPAINKAIVTKDGDSIELLETSAMNGGARVRARITFKAGAPLPRSHVHPVQDETYEVLSGRLAYRLNEDKRIAEAGETVTLPRGVSHQHYAEGPGDAVTVVTMTPGLDFDYLVENFFGLNSETSYANGPSKIQVIIWMSKLKAGIFLPGVPIGVQTAIARLVTPVAYRFGYRAVYRRFSGEEW
jgi:quercetin dioxygenase-like cupin family protein